MCNTCTAVHTPPLFHIEMCVRDHNACVYICIYTCTLCMCMYIYTHSVVVTCPETCWSRPKGAGVFWGSEGELLVWTGTASPLSLADSIAAISKERMCGEPAGPSRYCLPASGAAAFRLSCFRIPASGNSFHAPFLWPEVELVFYHPCCANPL